MTRFGQSVFNSTRDDFECHLKTGKNPHHLSQHVLKEADIDWLMSKHLIVFTTFNGYLTRLFLETFDIIAFDLWSQGRTAANVSYHLFNVLIQHWDIQTI